MANEEHLECLRRGVEVWNEWREKRPSAVPDLSEVNLSVANLRGANLTSAKLRRANLTNADLTKARLSEAEMDYANLSGANLDEAVLAGTNLAQADLTGANLTGADFVDAYLEGANLHGARLRGAYLDGADLSGADLTEADLSGAVLNGVDLDSANLRRADLNGAYLTGAKLLGTNLEDAVLTDCHIHGVSAWNVTLSEGTKQQNLVITDRWEPQVTTDDLELAQFVYLLLHNEKLRKVIDTITSKVVLILGRFSPERKAVLDALRDELRKRNYAPVVFDFEKSPSLTTDETVTLLARMARFVIADISDAKSVLQELRAIVPTSPRLPVQPIIVAGQAEPGMFDFFVAYPWFLKVHRYDTPGQLLADLKDQVIAPAEAKVEELRG